MTKRVLKNIDYLKLLQCSSKSDRIRLLTGAKSDQINAICDCIKNILLGNIEITPSQKKKLQPKKNLLRRLADKKTKSKERKKLLIQQGGSAFLPLLVSAVGGTLLKEILPKVLPRR